MDPENVEPSHINPVLDPEHFEPSHINSSIDPEHEEPSQPNRKGRGPAILKHLTKIKNSEERIKVVYNDNGQPIGTSKKDLAGYGGLLVKCFVPITYKSWHKVPKPLKDNMWSAIKVKFDVDPNTKKMVLSSMSTCWRAFKTQLTRKWINKLKDNPECLKFLPPKYGRYIKQTVWNDFVNERLSKNFQTLSNEQRERRFKIKHNHRMSKKGYAGLAEELKEKMGASYEDDRSLLWLKGREKRSGGYADESLNEVAEKVDDLKRQVNEGNLVTEGSSDVLTLALGTPEHAGRVRGKGFGVIPTRYFNLPKRGSKRHISELESELREAKQKLKILEAQMKSQNGSVPTPSSEKIASNAHKSDNREYLSSYGTSKNRTHSLKSKDDEKSHSRQSLPHSKSNIGKGGKCRLTIDSKTNIVAEGVVFERNGLNEKIHNIALGKHNVRVSIEKVISPNAILPIPVPGEMEFVQDALGSLVAWPEKFVLSSLENEKSEDVGGKKGGENDDDECNLISAFTLTLETMKTNVIKIPIVKQMFEEENVECYLFKKDLLDFCALQPVDVTCIVAYMSYLYDKFQGFREKVQFFNPSSFNAASKFNRVRLIGKRLQSAKRSQICFIPCNLKDMFHWVLIVIDLSTMAIYWLDSLNAVPTEQEKLYITTGLGTLTIDGKRLNAPSWQYVKCPMQGEESLACGYFVMKFMRYLIEDSSMSLETKMKRLSDKETYTIDEMNEVRMEFIEFVADYLM